MKLRLDQLLVDKQLVPTRHQAEVLIDLGLVKLNGRKAVKAGLLVPPNAKIQLAATAVYLSRGAYKLASVAERLKLNFQGKTVLDVGAAKGGFSDFALKNGATKVYAVDVGTAQLDPKLSSDSRVVEMSQTDIRKVEQLPDPADIAVADLSFISLRQVLPHVAGLLKPGGQIVAMVKPQFEVGDARHKLLHQGVVKNDTMRRQILSDFEAWARQHFKVVAKADSGVPGAKGNLERFFLLQPLNK